ncbi:sugar phosphate isomerase/epimerase [Alsobacter sp. KACC 23698]|uniref:Sugar phosphate isomerase/epimerase n=1 Tax=Alsobacter sp. KACC 23698 TaxID=3149229 RepID=A0AAU7JB02_9HYPH
MRQWSLSFLTCLGAAPEDAARAAAEAGYDFVGLRLAPASPGGVAFPLMDQPTRVRDLRRLMADRGIGVFDVEMIRLGPDFDVEGHLRLLECSADLGARVVLVAGDDPDESRLTASYAQLCAAAAPFGLCMDLEFMPQSELGDLAAARRVLEAADQPNQGVIVDALHVSRSRTPVADVAALPPAWLHYAQICDGPADIPSSREALNHAARHARLMPGDGGIDLAPIFAALPADLPIAVEVPNDAQSAGWSAADWARRGLASAKAALGEPKPQDRPEMSARLDAGAGRSQGTGAGS